MEVFGEKGSKPAPIDVRAAMGFCHQKLPNLSPQHAAVCPASAMAGAACTPSNKPITINRPPPSQLTGFLFFSPGRLAREAEWGSTASELWETAVCGDMSAREGNVADFRVRRAAASVRAAENPQTPGRKDNSRSPRQVAPITDCAVWRVVPYR